MNATFTMLEGLITRCGPFGAPTWVLAIPALGLFGRLSLPMVTGPSGRWSAPTSVVVFLALSSISLLMAALGASCLYAFCHPGSGIEEVGRRMAGSLSFLHNVFDSANPVVRMIGHLMLIAIVSIWGAGAVCWAERAWARVRKTWREMPRYGGVFVGEPKLVLLRDGRKAELAADFSFRDPRGRTWTAPAGTVVDGASIPSVFWQTFGTPFVGHYRNASIIHDYYCSSRTGRSSEVHRMFFEACLAGGCSMRRAKVAYWAVCRFGPYWGDEANRRRLRRHGRGSGYRKGANKTARRSCPILLQRRTRRPVIRIVEAQRAEPEPWRRAKTA